MKRVLILSYGFPPRGGGGVQRTAKFARYLPEFGWKPTVVTPKWDEGTRRELDASLAAEVKDTQVVYTGPPCSEGKNDFWRTLSELPVIWRVVGPIRANSQFPDYAARWIKQAVQAARPILETDRFDVIYSSSPPVSTHVAAMRLSKMFDLPWIADFRDPWTSDSINKKKRWYLREQLDQRLESQVIRSATHIVANTATNRNTLISRFKLGEDRVTTIPNGYDESDFIGAQSRRPSDFFRVTYSGSSYGTYNPEVFADSLARFFDKRPRASVKWTIAGTACSWAQKNLSESLKPHLEMLGYIPHSQIAELLMSSHLLVQAYPPGVAYSVPGKLYEYLRSGTQIIAIGESPSAVEKIVSQSERGVFFCHDDVGKIVDFLEDAYVKWEQAKWPDPLPPDARIAVFERRELTKRLAEQLSVAAEQRLSNPVLTLKDGHHSVTSVSQGVARVDDRG